MVDEKRAAEIAELEVRRYFDEYLNTAFPRQIAATQEYTRCSIEKHNLDDQAHGAVESRFNRFFWVLIGLSLAGGTGAGYTLSALLKAVGS